MYKALENSLFVSNYERFCDIQAAVKKFNALYNGANIVQDDVFTIAENYVRKNDMTLELLRIPVEDPEFCACTFIRQNRVFVMINTAMPVSKQIFAIAHELYHIYCFFEGEDRQSLVKHGSVLKSKVLEDASIEDIEANAFAGLLLAQREQLDFQISVYDIVRENLSWRDCVKLMDAFAIPYKAIVLRLYEEKMIDESKARDLFAQSSTDVNDYIRLTGKGLRWLEPTNTVQLGSLQENFRINAGTDSLTETRKESDQKRIDEIIQSYRKK